MYLDKLCRGVVSRVTLIDANGRVAYESEKELGGLDNHSDRPEFQTAAKTAASATSAIPIRLISKLFIMRRGFPMELS